jgi:DNA helicase-2/ATP-dependent DNA helicase PcrA
VEREFVYPLGRHDVRGMIDRIDRHPDGKLEVMDYKTYGDGACGIGNPAGACRMDFLTAGAVMEPRDELQLRYYGLGCCEALAKEPDLLTLYFVAASRRATVAYDRTGEDRLKAMILETADRIESSRFPPDTSFCPHCDFRKRCTHSVARD